ncbi:hypothetical protein K438DRAFT_1776353 [Mycena galopus ATCC 62051]|nr:hypothetical protein K438DRAFT_1776353 [Mycena galopus ATCC 62051]
MTWLTSTTTPRDTPTTYLQRDFTPMTFATSQMCARSPPGARAMSSPSPPPAKRRHVDSDDDSDGKQDQDDRDSDQEEEDATLSRRFNHPNNSVPRHIQKLLDLAAEDEDEDPELDDEEEDQETQADKDFLDDREQGNDLVIRIPCVDALQHEAEHDNAVALAAYYEAAAAAANYGSGDDENGKDEIPVISGTWVNAGIGEHTRKETLIGYAPVKIQQQLSIELTHGTWIRAGNRRAMVLSTSIERTYRASPTRERSGQSATSGTQRYREVLLIRALADPDDDSEMVVVPGTWVKTQKGPQTHKGIAFVLSTTELYQDVHIIQARRPTEPPRERPAFHVIRAKLQKGSDQRSAFPKSRYPRLDPTPEQLLLFVGSCHPDLLTLPFHGLSPALAEGDRVVMVAGEHKGLNGFIFALAERWDKKEEQNVQYAKLVTPGLGGVYQTRKHLHTGNDGGHDNSGRACVELAHLKRSALDICYTFRINDRVRVVSGILYKGVIGGVTAVANDSLTISIPKDCDVVGRTTAHFDDQSFTISIEHVTREWHLGDSVRVRCGEYKDSVGVIVGAPTAGVLQIFCGNRKTGVEHTLGEPDARLLQVRAAEVDCEAESASLKEGTAPYTRPGYLVAPSGVNPPTAAEREYMKGGCTQLETQRALMHTGRGWYQGMDVVVVGHVGWLLEGTQKVGGTRCPLHAGLRGVVVGDYDSPVRAAQLKSTRRRTALPLRDDQQGILVTIGEHAGNRQFSNIPIENVFHAYKRIPITQARFLPRKELEPPSAPRSRTPPPTPLHSPARPLRQLDGEDTGQWISMLELAMKRIDVQVVGVLKLPKTSPKVAGLEGKCSWLLVGMPPPASQQKMDVLGIGSGGMKHAIPRNCIKPRHGGNGGKHIVLGPDVNSDLGCRGQYAQTIPYFAHVHGFGVTAVKFPGGGEPAYFYSSSLALVKNIRLQSLDGIFEVTNF